MKLPPFFISAFQLFSLSAFTLALASCAHLTLRAATPFGDISTTNGHSTITLRPIIIEK